MASQTASGLTGRGQSSVLAALEEALHLGDPVRGRGGAKDGGVEVGEKEMDPSREAIEARLGRRGGEQPAGELEGVGRTARGAHQAPKAWIGSAPRQLKVAR